MDTLQNEKLKDTGENQNKQDYFKSEKIGEVTKVTEEDRITYLYGDIAIAHVPKNEETDKIIEEMDNLMEKGYFKMYHIANLCAGIYMKIDSLRETKEYKDTSAMIKRQTTEKN